MKKIFLISIIAYSLFSFNRYYSLKDTPENLRELYNSSPEKWPKPNIDNGVLFSELGPLPKMGYPKDNLYSREKNQLGKMLFFDPRLSKSGSIACASCHDPELGWADGRPQSFGHARRKGNRNSMSIINTGYYSSLFWDGRASNLEEQLLFPIQDHSEMNMSIDSLINNLNKITGYKSKFREVFGENTIKIEYIQKALATFERSIVSRKSAFDAFLEGKSSALTDQQILGLHLFRTKARCINCHNGPFFTNQQFHNNGQSHLGRPSEDLGLYLISGDTADVGKFRTPSLRDVTFTGPWLHNGLLYQLEEVIGMYNIGMPQVIPKSHQESPLYPEKSPLLKPLSLNKEEKEALIAFLESISSKPYRLSIPKLPE
ncbi:cytochrome-c peroxidase [Chondrinema litorale]|uniref:cytochrome-c peroxidase n=1 Tax=Chondrinema litorale TaxID=2994555 RepID=UPI002543CCB2|nr:cytochrome c peroxidase [Chondrinema litorale]UZR97118.1 hypothetical protein OQ292_23765 [Chondrinema litorale]